MKQIGRLNILTDNVLQTRFSHVELTRLAIAGGALLLTVGVAGAQETDDPHIGISVEGPVNLGLLHPVLHTHDGPDYQILPPPPDDLPEANAGPISSGNNDAVLKDGDVGAAIVGPRSTGSIYTAKQQADREIRRLIRELD